MSASTPPPGGWRGPAAWPPAGSYGPLPGPAWGGPQAAGAAWGGRNRPAPPRTAAPQAGPPRRGGGLRLLALCLAGLALLAVAGLVLAGLLARPTVVAYQNEDYQVPPAETQPPPLPRPADRAQAEQWTKANPIYGRLTPAPVRCASTPIDVATADDALLKSHFEGLMECLLRVWEPPLTEAGFAIFRPTVTIYGSQVSTKCGSGDLSHNAFYCGADQQIYWSRTLGGDLTPFARSPRAGDEVMAHEFGHAVQGRAGILVSKNVLRTLAPDQATSLEIARRNETQADCLAGLWIRSVSRSVGMTQADVAVTEDNFASGGDDVIAGKKPGTGNHGHSTTRRYWGTVGLSTAEVGRCNTYAAPSSQVR